MKKILHLLTENQSELTQTIIREQKNSLTAEVEVVDLRTEPLAPQELLEKIFTADSVAVW
jgi:hypothetical protein